MNYKVLFIVGGMLVLWILSSWIHDINIIIVAIIGCSLLFFPGIDILDTKTFVKENSWDAFFLVGALTSMCNMILKNGIIQTVVDAIPPFTSSVVLMSDGPEEFLVNELGANVRIRLMQQMAFF